MLTVACAGEIQGSATNPPQPDSGADGMEPCADGCGLVANPEAGDEFAPVGVVANPEGGDEFVLMGAIDASGIIPNPDGGADADAEPCADMGCGLVANPEGGDETAGGGFYDGPLGVVANPEAGRD